MGIQMFHPTVENIPIRRHLGEIATWIDLKNL